MKPFLTIVIASLTLANAYSQTEMTSGNKIEHAINIGESHVYKVKVKKGAFYKLLLVQKGIDLQINLRNGSEKETIFDSPNGLEGPEPISFLAAANGYITLNVKPLDDSIGNTKTGGYSIEYLQAISANDYAAMLRQKEAGKIEFIEWIKQASIPLISVKAGAGFTDLDALKLLLMNKRVVGIGEATHGTKEFFQMKHRMLEFLVTQLGYTVFAIEASYGRCKYINDYVLTGKGDLDTATVIQAFTTWSTEEVREMIRWMRTYNEANPTRKIQFVGYDLQANDAVEFAVSNYYAKVDVAKKAQVDSLLKKVDEAERSGGIFSGDTSIKTLIAPVEALITAFIEKGGEYIFKTGRQAYEETLWSIRVLHQYLVSYSFNNFSEVVKKEDRDFYMAQNILSWLAYFPPATKMMVWAHNGHIAKDYLNGVSVPSMGSYLKAVLKDDYYAIGFDFYKGRFQSNDIDLKNSAGWEEHEVGEAPEGNLSSYFVKAGLGNSFLDLSAANQNKNIKNWLGEERIGTYSIGSQFSKKWGPSNYIVPMKLSEAFDGIIFIKESNRAVPVKWLTIDAYKF